ncbi:MAG: hypothetical protein ACI91G_000722 [Gammaproteobacteria bacterium]|jgi:hypothetical protein
MVNKPFLPLALSYIAAQLWAMPLLADASDGAEKETAKCNTTTTQQSELRRPGPKVLRSPETKVLRWNDQCDKDDSLAIIRGLPDAVLVSDRWRIVSTLGYEENLWDPYSSNNWLKGDRPVFGEDWFVSLIGIADFIVEPRNFPIPVGNATTLGAGGLNLIGDGDTTVTAGNLILETVLYKGNTTFRPPDYEFRFTPVINYNILDANERGITRADPSAGTYRKDSHIGIQAALFDYHIRNVSDRFDFDSVRIGIQPFNADFRGFLFNDQQFGVRLFGIRDNNIFQYNLAWFRRLEKDTNSGLNDVGAGFRDDDVFVANIYWQDQPKLGYVSQFVLLHNRNREAGQSLFDANGFIVRPASIGIEVPRDYDVTYFGYNGDGHWDRINITFASYYAIGEESSGTFTNQAGDIGAYFLAAELGFDQSWARWRFSFLHASGDDDPFDNDAGGFDAVFENPLFAGADTSYWIRQTVPLIGGGRVALSGRNGILNSLRSSKEQGQSNFTNPGITLLGLGTDLDLTPTTRLSVNANHLWFADTTVLEVARNQGTIATDIGFDLSIAATYRPFATQNIVGRLSAAYLIPGKGFEDLYGTDQAPYSILANLTLMY